MSSVREALQELVACDTERGWSKTAPLGSRVDLAWAAARAALASSAAQAQGAEVTHEPPHQCEMCKGEGWIIQDSMGIDEKMSCHLCGGVGMRRNRIPIDQRAEVAQEPPAPPSEDGPATVDSLVHWLDAKYSRHKEIEDYDAARMLEAQRGEIAKIDGYRYEWRRNAIAVQERAEKAEDDLHAARQALSDAASELPQCAGPIAERIRVYRQSYEDKITAARDLAAQLWAVVRAADAMRDQYRLAARIAGGNLDKLWSMQDYDTLRAALKDSNG